MWNVKHHKTLWCVCVCCVRARVWLDGDVSERECVRGGQIVRYFQNNDKPRKPPGISPQQFIYNLRRFSMFFSFRNKGQSIKCFKKFWNSFVISTLNLYDYRVNSIICSCIISYRCRVILCTSHCYMCTTDATAISCI